MKTLFQLLLHLCLLLNDAVLELVVVLLKHRHFEQEKVLEFHLGRIFNSVLALTFNLSLVLLEVGVDRVTYIGGYDLLHCFTVCQVTSEIVSLSKVRRQKDKNL